MLDPTKALHMIVGHFVGLPVDDITPLERNVLQLALRATNQNMVADKYDEIEIHTNQPKRVAE